MLLGGVFRGRGGGMVWDGLLGYRVYGFGSGWFFWGRRGWDVRIS